MSLEKPPPSFNLKVVEPIPDIPQQAREDALRSVHYNVFAFPAALVAADFLSDSGTAAMTDVQWAALMRGDESYGRNTGYYCLLETVRDIFERGENRLHTLQKFIGGLLPATELLDSALKYHDGGFVNGGKAQIIRPNTFIVPQGRCAESLFFEAIMRSAQSQNILTPTVVSNGFFDTTKANADITGFRLKTLHGHNMTFATNPSDWRTRNTFSGNMDLDAIGKYLLRHENQRSTVLILLTITNNRAAGQPVSMSNIKAVSEIAAKYHIPVIFDACRFAENAKFIKEFEDGYQNTSIGQIVQQMFQYVDGFTISLKKDAMANMGGILCLRDGGKFTTRHENIGTFIKERQIIRYGNDSYGGMSGRDLLAAATGLFEGTENRYLTARLEQTFGFAEKLSRAHLPVLLPPGASAVFLDMDKFFEDHPRPYGDFASLGFTLQLLGSYGVRAFEAGPFAWEWDKLTDEDRSRTANLVRFAIPRNRMTEQHFEYTVAAVEKLWKERHQIPSVRIVHGQDLNLRHFQCMLEPVSFAFNGS